MSDRWAMNIKQGATNTYTMNLTVTETGAAVDLSAYTGARMQVRKTLTATGTILDLTSAGGDIDVSALAAGQVIVNLTSTGAALDFQTGVVDLELFDTSDPPLVRRLVAGTSELDKEVTR